MEKRVDASLLLSFYSAILTERQREMLCLHYEDDLSLSEIASLYGVTRQGAHDAIRRGEAQLLSLEAKLGLCGKWTRLCEQLAACRAALGAGETDRAATIIDDMLREEEALDGV